MEIMLSLATLFGLVASFCLIRKIKQIEREKLDLQVNLTETKEEVENLTYTVQEERQSNEKLTNQRNEAYQLNRQLTKQLDKDYQLKQHLTSQLNKEYQLKQQLESQLEEANLYNQRVTNQLDKAYLLIQCVTNQHNKTHLLNKHIANQFDEANQRINQLTRNIAQVNQSNENAIRLLCLSIISLQVCGIALQRESNRAAGLMTAYENLEYAFRDLCEGIERKAKRRVFRKGIVTVISWIPIIGTAVQAIDLCSEISEMLSVTAEATEALDAAEEDYLELIGSDKDSISDAEFNILIEGANLALSAIEVSETRNIIMQHLKRNGNTNNPTPESSQLNIFVMDILKHTKNLIKSWPEDKYDRVVAGIVSNFQQYKYQLSLPANIKGSH